MPTESERRLIAVFQDLGAILDDLLRDTRETLGVSEVAFLVQSEDFQPFPTDDVF